MGRFYIKDVEITMDSENLSKRCKVTVMDKEQGEFICWFLGDYTKFPDCHMRHDHTVIINTMQFQEIYVLTMEYMRCHGQVNHIINEVLKHIRLKRVDNAYQMHVTDRSRAIIYDSISNLLKASKTDSKTVL